MSVDEKSEHDAMFVLKTNTDITSIETIQKLERMLDDVMLAFGLTRTGTSKGDDIKICYNRTAYRPY